MSETAQRYYLPQLNGLRFMVFLWVFIDHFPLDPPMPDAAKNLMGCAWLAVQVLFIHAAFLFTKLLLIEQKATGHIDIMRFYIRRALRILPAYYFYIALVVLTQFQYMQWNENKWLRLLGLLTFTDNIFCAGSGLFSRIPYTAHLYSVSILVQIYLVMPWFFLVLQRSSAHRRIVLCLLISGAAMLARYYCVSVQVNRLAIEMLPILNPDYILVGMLLAFFNDAPMVLSRKSRWLVMAGWMITIVLSLIFMVSEPESVLSVGGIVVQLRRIYFYPITALALGGLIYFITKSNGEGALVRWLSVAPLRYLGKIIYGLYVYHFACLPASVALLTYLGWAKEQTYAASLPLLLVSLGMTIGVAALSYRYLEKPFLLLKERFTVALSRPV